MMAGQQAALLRLLSDDDPDTVALVKKQLLEIGNDAVPDMRALLMADNAIAARHAREVLDDIETREANNAFTLLCHMFPVDGDIERASWMLATSLTPGLDVGRYQRQLDVWGRELAEALHGAKRPGLVVRTLAEFMTGDLGFRGNAEDYYNASNSLLPDVMDTRLGIPISLTLLYLAVARRAGITIEGINLPGHFIARHGDILFDPYNGGTQLSESDVEAILAKQHLPMQPSYLAAATPRQMLSRVLVNLAHIYTRDEETPRRVQVSGWLKALLRR